jgi:hypothetical protein
MKIAETLGASGVCSYASCIKAFDAPGRATSARLSPKVVPPRAFRPDRGAVPSKSTREVAQMVASLRNSFPLDYWTKLPINSNYFVNERNLPNFESAYPVYAFGGVYVFGGSEGLSMLRNEAGLELHFHAGNPLPQLVAMDYNDVPGGQSWLNFHDAPPDYRAAAIRMMVTVQAQASNSAVPIGVVHMHF